MTPAERNGLNEIRILATILTDKAVFNAVAEEVYSKIK